jgi:hypothetical protein
MDVVEERSALVGLRIGSTSCRNSHQRPSWSSRNRHTRWWDLHEVVLDYMSPGNPYDSFSDAGEQPETPIVLLRGDASVIHEFPEGADELIDI